MSEGYFEEVSLPPKSTCCNAPLKVISGDEGTSYYECTTCGRPADVKEHKHCYHKIIGDEYAPFKPDIGLYSRKHGKVLMNKYGELNLELCCFCGAKPA